MKKTLFVALILMLGMSAVAQEKKPIREKNNYIAFTAGLALPVGDFASTSSDLAGMATTGFNVSIHGGYAFARRIGLGGNLFYSSYGIDKGILAGTGIDADHWQYYGIAVGPFVSVVKTTRFTMDLKLYGGFATANAPVIKLENFSTNDSWSSASFVLQPGLGLRFDINPALLLVGNIDYTTLNPRFEGTDLGTYEQKMSAMHIGVGLGFRF